jgi:hypothetical protein
MAQRPGWPLTVGSEGWMVVSYCVAAMILIGGLALHGHQWFQPQLQVWTLLRTGHPRE